MRVTVGSRPANFGASAALATRWRTRPRSNRSFRSFGVSKRGRRDHHGAKLHRRQHHLPQRHDVAEHQQDALAALHAECAQTVGDAVGALGQFGEGRGGGAVADDRQRQAVGALAACQLGVEPVEGVVEMIQLRPAESRMRRAIVGAVREQEVACRLERLGSHCCLPIAVAAPPASGTPPRNPWRRRRHRPPPDRTTSHARRVASAIRPRRPLPATASRPSASAPP